MLDFFKTFGSGLLYLILTPFIAVYFAICMVFYAFIFLIMLIKRIVMFFKGEDMKKPLKVDLEAQRILATPLKKPEPVNTNPQIIAPTIQPIFIQAPPGTVIASGMAIGPNGQPVMVNVASNQPNNQVIENQTPNGVQQIQNASTYLPNQEGDQNK